jgi:hypothetical protein
MNTKRAVLRGFVLMLVLGAMMAFGCNMPSLPAGQAPAGSSQPGYGQRRVEYGHHFTFDLPRLHVNIQVSGYVPLNVVQNGTGTSDCEPGVELLYEQLSGSSNVNIAGSAEFISGDKRCSCELSDTVEVEASAKTFYEEGQYEGRCALQYRTGVQLREVWFTSPHWRCRCDDPEAEPLVQMALSSTPAIANPYLEGRTIVFDSLCPGSYLEEEFADPTGFGSGTYRWTWRPGSDEPSEPGQGFPTYEPYSLDSDLYPSGQPSCVSVAQAHWGPALDAIVQPVTEWFPAR